MKHKHEKNLGEKIAYKSKNKVARIKQITWKTKVQAKNKSLKFFFLLEKSVLLFGQTLV